MIRTLWSFSSSCNTTSLPLIGRKYNGVNPMLRVVRKTHTKLRKTHSLTARYKYKRIFLTN